MGGWFAFSFSFSFSFSFFFRVGRLVEGVGGWEEEAAEGLCVEEEEGASSSILSSDGEKVEFFYFFEVGLWVDGWVGLGRGSKGGWTLVSGWVGGWAGGRETYPAGLIDVAFESVLFLGLGRKREVERADCCFSSCCVWDRWVGGWVGGLGREDG